MNLDDLLQFLQQTPARISQIIKGLTESEFRLKNSDEEFSVLENICHLRDIEVEGYSPRIDRILTEHKPFLPDVDGSRLAIERNYNNQNLESALEVLTNARTKNIQTLRAADETQLDREAMLEGVGSITLRTLVQMMSEHDEDHINDLRTIRRRLNS